MDDNSSSTETGKNKFGQTDLVNEQTNGGKEKVLIVDDMLLHLETAKLYLGKSGFEVFCASDIKNAWELLIAEEPELVLLDLVMPGESGLNLLAKIRAQYPQIGVVVMTAFGSEEIAATAMKNGSLDYIRKPVKYSELTSVVQHALVKQRQLNYRAKSISNLQTAYEELQVSSDSILHCMSAGVVALDNLLRIKMINYAALKFFDLENQNVLGKDFYATLPDLKKNSLLKQTLINEKGFRLFEVAHQGPEKDLLFSVNTDVLFDHHGHKIGVLAVFDEISEQRNFQKLLKERERLTIIGQMAAGMAHEIKNPLTAIKGFAQLLSTKIKDPTIKEYLTIMDDEINRMSQVIRDFLQLARPKAPNFERTDINLLFHDITSIIGPQAFLKGIETSLKTDSMIPESLMDPGQIKQVVLNLTQNALEVMDKGGKLTLETKYLHAAKEIRLDVHDTGCGIPRDKIKNLGVPFYTTKPEGTGVGLSIVFSIVEQHGGRINVQSEEGRGTTFSVFLPVR
ncbi:Signal transduction histidine kinase, nitrogen specific [Desulfotomaculum arcticum]|uniref:Stage 0 sporulation protein A homolog n=1 Tax=Desulfotruncus arcticus DSM 17038 TaxID=1121424 RepID=A0A1I2UEG7_9FIRM|nr:ATP-binding protein [Desulfotruncus arcticus]SFG75572.1 Signal transduction histidine kinase, nitrogen specific [Desulfotomaculum arcticum] [Desulfotruncus arcticus DSM 17038]